MLKITIEQRVKTVLKEVWVPIWKSEDVSNNVAVSVMLDLRKKHPSKRFRLVEQTRKVENDPEP